MTARFAPTNLFWRKPKKVAYGGAGEGILSLGFEGVGERCVA